MPNHSGVTQSESSSGEYPLSVHEVARILGCGESSVRTWADTGRLPCWRTPGGHRRFRRADVDALLPEITEAAS